MSLTSALSWTKMQFIRRELDVILRSHSNRITWNNSLMFASTYMTVNGAKQVGTSKLSGVVCPGDNAGVCSLTLCASPRAPCSIMTRHASNSGGSRDAAKLAEVEKRQLQRRKKEAKRLTRLEGQRLRLEKQKAKEAEAKNNVVSYIVNTKPGDKKDVSGPLPAAYSPPYTEAAWYEWWENMAFFAPKQANSCDDERFVMCLPPPNVTGTLHLGHALGNSIEDAIVRWHRMSGRRTLWNPGCDHAGIATQVVVERKLWREQGKTRHTLGRSAFTDEVWRWKDEKGERIYEQMKRLGSSLDWSRACFTLDHKLSKAVTEAFIRLHDEGLIYRDNWLVNWSCALKSAISDIEVDDVGLEGKTYLPIPGYKDKVMFGVMSVFAYPIHESHEEISVATTRLETMLGDAAVAVHPDDPRYASLHGRQVLHPLTGALLPIVCDEHVDRELGTGAVKITPAHDQNDFALGRRHNLGATNVLDDEGHMVNVPTEFQGLKRFDARQAVLKALQRRGLYRATLDHPMVLPMCSRSKDVIEPRLKEQWFLDCHQMAQQAMEVVHSGELKLVPQHYEKQWFDWLENTRDWCISRQLWWGHRIPAFRITRRDQQSTVSPPMWVSAHSEDEALLKASKRLGVDPSQLTSQQDEDVLDTWFSSALFPFSIFGWPDQTEDLANFYPTQLLETASDIMFFWVARMVMLGQKLTGTLPFREVLFHSILRDAHGRKMSKSLGNVIDPMDVMRGVSLEELQKQLGSSSLSAEEVKKALRGQQRDFPLGIPECGADALRYTLCSYNYKAHFVNVDISGVQANRHFCNKIWQAFRFTLSALGDDYIPPDTPQGSGEESATDVWILSRLSNLVAVSDEGFRQYDLNHVTRALHQFWKAELCDIYLEYCKVVLQSGSHAEKAATRDVLYTCVDAGLRALSPFMPFLTEELFQRLPGRKESDAASICIAPYPSPMKYSWEAGDVERDMGVVKELVSQALALRKIFNLTKTRTDVYIGGHADVSKAIRSHSLTLKTLSRSDSVTPMDPDDSPPQGCIREQSTDGKWTFYMKLKGIIDVGEEVSRLRIREDELQQQLQMLLHKHQHTASLAEHVVLAEQEKVAALKADLRRLSSAVESLTGLS